MFIDARSVPKDPNMRSTLQGAAAYSSSGNKCLDLFFVAGAMRDHDIERLNMHFVEAYRENPELAMKLLFHIRDIREGMGERDIFRRLIRTVAKKWPESAIKNVRYISEYGRWDDLICLTGTKAEKEVVRVIREQLAADTAALERRKNGELDAHISLCAKWMPSSNTSSSRTRGQAKVMMHLLGMNEKSYRKMLVPLRRAVSLTEHYVTNRNLSRIQYEHVPSQALLRYDRLFTKFDNERYETFIRSVRGGFKKLPASTLTPSQIIRRTCYFDFEIQERKGIGRVKPFITNFYYSRYFTYWNLVNRCYRHHSGKFYYSDYFKELQQYQPKRRSWKTVIPLSVPFYGIQDRRRYKAYIYNLRRFLKRNRFICRLEAVGRSEKFDYPFYCSDPHCICTVTMKCLTHHTEWVPGEKRGKKHEFCKTQWIHNIHARAMQRSLPPRHTISPKLDPKQYDMVHVDDFWKALPGYVSGEKAISIIDTSASMQCYGAYSVAISLGLFHAQHATGPFHNKFITFSETPRMIKLRGEDLGGHLWQIYQSDWGSTTNLEAVFDMLLKMAIRNKAGKGDMPTSIVIYSDMEFNRSVTNPDDTIFDDARKKFEEAGFELPAVSFHNVNSLSMQTPVLADTRGASLSSGRSTHHMKQKIDRGTTPLSNMLSVLLSERYACIHA